MDVPVDTAIFDLASILFLYRDNLLDKKRLK
jgi:hypothetical protein